MATQHETRPVVTASSDTAIERAGARGKNDARVPSKANRWGKSNNLSWMARSMTDDGAEVLRFYARVLRGEEMETIVDKDGTPHQVPASLAIRAQCGERLLDRAVGKAPLTIVHESDSDNPLGELTLEALTAIRQALATPAPIVTIDIPPTT
jgi:hypothetical protein